jgi:hypothetical protein
MSKRRITVGAAAVSMLAAAALSAGITPAHADLAPQKNDVVGVGSDAVQNLVDFLADGVKLNGTTYAGYNETKAATKWRLDDIDASGDANGGTTTNATVVLQAGTAPVNRPNGGTAGLLALENDGANGKSAGLIDFARTPSAPSATDESTAEANLGTHLDWVTLATDTQYLATTSTTNAPSVITPAEALNIYEGKILTWGDLAKFRTTETGASSLPAWSDPAPTAKIVAFYPQNGAGMQKIFLAGLTAANGGTAVSTSNLGSNALQVKQNDPITLLDPSKAVNPTTGASYGLTASQAADVIVPIPQSKYNLFKDGYFLDGSKPYSAASGSQSALGTSGWQLLTGTGSFASTTAFDIVFRDSDYASKTGWQSAKGLNWVQSLFWNPSYNPATGGKTIVTKTVKGKNGKKKKVKTTVVTPAPYAFSKTGQALIKALGLVPQSYATAFNSWQNAK